MYQPLWLPVLWVIQPDTVKLNQCFFLKKEAFSRCKDTDFWDMVLREDVILTDDCCHAIHT